MSNVISLQNEMYKAGYVYNKGCSTLRNSGNDLTIDEYNRRAKYGIPALRKKVTSFLDQHKLSYVIIPFDRYQAYEKSHTQFRELYNQVCSERGVNPSAVDVAIIEPNVKDLESCKRKGQDRYANFTFDYLRTTLITTNNRQINNKPLLHFVLQKLDDSEDSLARKNYYHTPHKKSAIRYFKRFSLCNEGDSSNEILEETMLKTIEQIDLDTLTRHFLNLERETLRMTKGFSKAGSPEDMKRYLKVYNRSQTISNAIKETGKSLYNRLFHDTEITQKLLGQKNSLPPLRSYQEILDNAMEQITKFFPTDSASERIRNTIIASGVFPDEITKSPQNKVQKCAKKRMRSLNLT